MRPTAERLAPWLGDGVDVYAYFNNDYHGHAVVDAMTLRELLDAVAAHPQLSNVVIRRGETGNRGS